METISLCDIIEVHIYLYIYIYIYLYIYIYIYIYVYTQQYSTIVSNYNFYLVGGDMFRLLMQPSSGQLKAEQEP